MRTTCTANARYVGADLTDGYAQAQRPIDVCGLDTIDGKLDARFWQWTYDGGIDDVGPLLPEIRGARGAVLDGPQALARPHASMRECERILGAAGETPSVTPTRGPFSGFVRTSVELFGALDRGGIAISSASLVGAACEHYPGGNWRRLAGSLPSKKRPEGIAARRVVLEALTVRFPDGVRLTDDHLDACLGAVIAAAADGCVKGARVERCGADLVRDGSRLREGPILLLALDEVTSARLVDALGKVAMPVSGSAQRSKRTPAAAPGLVRVGVTRKLLESDTNAIAVEGLVHLKADKEQLRKIQLPEYQGHLWLGDHGCFWPKHQKEDPVAVDTYKRLRDALIATPDDYEDVEAILDDASVTPP
ncbi:MAG: DUF429 domain-containing protein [Labilithrix sp.]|nr:DUF429 domain-containing protein [Labilithrix sp.]